MGTGAPPGRLGEVAQLFLRLGATAFGGPAAHIAMMHDEVVTRRKWVDDQHFLDLLGATNLIPGPNSTEMAIHLGYVRAGWRGLIVAGTCFVVPAMLIVIAIAWAFQRFGTTPQAVWLLYGVKPVVIAVVALALWELGKKVGRSKLALAVGGIVAALNLLGANQLLLLLAGGAFVGAATYARRRWHGSPVQALLPIGLVGLALQAAAVPFSLDRLFLVFLKIGSVLYGSGYVLLAFLQADFVERLGWITQDQLLTAVAVGQFTPGPVFTTATFIGFLLDGVPGALVATIGIFLPAFVFVAISNPFIPRIRKSPWASAILDGVNAASLGLMAAVTLQLARDALVDPLTMALALVAGVLLFRFRVNSVWIILGGAAVGLIAGWLQLRV
jgi:chromate transporter